MAENTKTPNGLMKKLFEIQTSLKSFAVTEDSDKSRPDGKSEYRYTPGWEITEKLREEMDKRKLMLIPNFVSQESQPIEYPVYKNFNGTAMSFQKKEMYVTVQIDFTWHDVETGESFGPIRALGFGANGTDKSGATAISMAERYFLLRFFHFTTHELTDEQDAHDSGNIPGIPAGTQLRTLPEKEAPKAVPVQAYGSTPQPQQPVAAQPGQFVQTQVFQAAPAYGPGMFPTPGPGNYPMPQSTVPVGDGTFNPNHPLIRQAIAALAVFEKGTATHQRALNAQIGTLSAAGFQCTTQEFITALVETAQAAREGRA